MEFCACLTLYFISVYLCFIYLACDQTYTALIGNIKSMNYPENYASNLYCKYLINSLQKPGYIISISFSNFDIQYSDNCQDDMVSVFDGGTSSAPLLGSYCGTTKPPTLRSSGNKVLIILKSNAIATSKGFQLSYQTGNLKALLSQKLQKIGMSTQKGLTLEHITEIHHHKKETV